MYFSRVSDLEIFHVFVIFAIFAANERSITSNNCKNYVEKSNLFIKKKNVSPAVLKSEDFQRE